MKLTLGVVGSGRNSSALYLFIIPLKEQSAAPMRKGCPGRELGLVYQARTTRS